MPALFEAYKRWRHTRGYGVHSPFAFRIVSDIIRCPYDYYGYHDIDASLEKHSASPSSAHRRLRRHARFLLRLADFVQPYQVFLFQGAPAPLRTAIEAACPRAPITHRKQAAASCPLIIAEAGSFTISELRDIISSRQTTLWLRGVKAAQAPRLLPAMTQGIALIAPCDILILTRPGLTPVSYTINL